MTPMDDCAKGHFNEVRIQPKLKLQELARQELEKASCVFLIWEGWDPWD